MASNNPRLRQIAVLLAGFLLLPFGGLAAQADQPPDLIHQPYQLNTGLASRSISFENPTGAPGEGGKAASPLGVGRKGLPAKDIKPGQTVQLCDIEGPGTIRHIWVTTAHEPAALRGLVLRRGGKGRITQASSVPWAISSAWLTGRSCRIAPPYTRSGRRRE